MFFTEISQRQYWDFFHTMVIRRARAFLDSVKSSVTFCVTGGFRDSSDIAKALELGADAVALATASMIAVGCIQSRVYHTGICLVGIATQDEALWALFDEKKPWKVFKTFIMLQTRNSSSLPAQSLFLIFFPLYSIMLF